MATLNDIITGAKRPENNGSRLGYLLGKTYEGFSGALEGATDFVGAGISKLLGDEEAARLYFEHTNPYIGTADYRFNPSGGWKIAGDVAQGIGNSLPMLGASVLGGAAVGGIVGAAGLTGTAANVATTVGNGIVTFTSSFLSSAGSGVQEAYKKTGKLDEKAWRSGIASGAIEGATETFIDPILGGATSTAIKLGGKIAGTAAKATASRVSSKISVQVAKSLVGAFLSEAIEEGVSGILSPIANNIIYRSEIANGEMEKETLDWRDIGYQMLVGGLSGAIMGGVNIAASNAVSTVQGAQAIKSGNSENIIKGAQEILNAYADDDTMVNTEAYKSLQNTLKNAESAKGLSAARYISELKTASAAVTLSDQVVTSARNILSNPEMVANRINNFDLKDVDGKAIKVTTQQIIEASKNGDLAKALTEENNILRKLSVLDAAGRLYADTQAYEEAVEQGNFLGDRADVAHFLQTATPEEIAAINKALGDDFDITSASYEDLRRAFTNSIIRNRFQAQNNPQIDWSAENAQQTAQAAPQNEGNAQAASVSAMQNAEESAQTASSAEKATKTDENSKSASSEANADTANSSQERTKASERGANTSEEEKTAQTKKNKARATAEANKTLAQNISKWEKMPSRNRTLVRQTYMEAIANGYSRADALTFARLSAKTGINVEFSENGMTTAKGDTIDGYYDRSENVIVVNPKSKKPFESLLIHELTHSLEKTNKYGKVMRTALNSISEAERERVLALYKPLTRGKNAVEKVETLNSEYTAHFTEKALKSKAFLNALVKEDATVKDKILSFFKQRFGDEKLDRAARKLAKAYEKAFNEMAQANFGANSASASVSPQRQYSISKYTDSEGNRLSTDQEKFFENSRVRDKNGNLLVMYHGSESAFTVFDNKKPIINGNHEGYGMYFTSYITEALVYADNKGNNLYEVYLNAKNPIISGKVLSNEERKQIVIDADKKYMNGKGYSKSFLNKVYNAEINASNYDHFAEMFAGFSSTDAGFYGYLSGVADRESVLTTMEEHGYDSVIVDKNGRTNVIVFSSEQVKSVDNKTPTSNPDIRYSISASEDSEYLELAKDPVKNEAKLRKMVKDAAIKAGYDSPILYHGTDKFGFTTFDLSKMDDRRSIFLTDSERVASTYSGVAGTRKVSETANIPDNISPVVLASELNANMTDQEKKNDYSYMSFTKNAVDILVKENRNDLLRIKDFLKTVELDFSKEHYRGSFEKLKAELGKPYDPRNNDISTPLYMLTEHAGVFAGHRELRVLQVEPNIRLAQKLLTYMDESGKSDAIAKMGMGGYDIEILSIDDAKEELKKNSRNGNYALVGKTNNIAKINSDGKLWKKIGYQADVSEFYQTIQGAHGYRIYNTITGQTLYISDAPSGEFATREEAEEKIKEIQSGNNSILKNAILDTTREISKWAFESGYDGVLFENIMDNGGRNVTVPLEEKANVYIYFSPSFIKSADLVTYDDKGNIIPLSERFNPSNNDIRYSISESEDQTSTGGGTQSSVLSSRTTVPQQSVDARLKKQANRFEIDFVNEFAGIESFLKESGADASTVESAIQSARSAYSRGQSQIGYGVLDSAEMRKKGGDLTIKQPGLQKIFADVRDKGDEYAREFFDYLLHMHNVDRMSLEERSKQTLATLEQIRDIMENDKSGTAKEKIAALKQQIRFFDVAKTLEGVQKQIDSFEIEENKPVFGNNEKEKALLDESIETLNAEVVRLTMKGESRTRKENRDLKNAKERLEYLRGVRKNYVVRKEAVTAEESEAIAEAYEKKHPEFRAKAEQVWEYNKQINRNRANDGLLSERDVEYYEDKYPHYVPTFRESYSTGISPLQGKNNIAIRQTVSAAEGGGGTIAPLDESMAKQTLAAVRAGSVNILANMIYDSAMRGNTDEVEIVSVKKVTRSEAYDANYEEETPKGNEITFYRDGEKITMRVSREIFAGFDAINGTIDFQNPAMTMLQKVMDIFKKSVTTYNPLFVIRNKFRDVQDAGFNTKYGAKFAKMLFSGRAEREIKSNSKLWQAFVAAGGMSNTAFDVNEGFQRRVGDRGFIELRNNPAAKVIDMVNIANDFVEQTTRFTEFILSIEAGNSVEQAILDSQEVTTNFGRKGRIAKKFNATISPFLNPSIQGFDKIIRNVKDATKTKQAFLALMFKVALLGIIPQVLNEFLHGFDDDDEYDELSDYVKTNNFLFKVGNVFIRIPKGRLSSAIAGAVVQTSNAVEGRNVDIKGYVENTLSQMSPVENVTRTIFSPVTDVINNRSWSGGTIESQKFENVAPEYRFDERTSSIAIALGKVLKYSPKKIHYLLDQYTGVFGDIILPATSAAAQKDMFSANMTVDAVSSNRLSGDFYKLYDDVNYKTNDPKASDADRQTAADQARFLNRVKSAVSDLQQQKTEIQNSKKTKKEKLEETKVIQALINEAYRQAFSEYKTFSSATNKYSDIENADERFAYEMRDSVGAEAALKHYNASVYEKSVYLNTAGISYDTYFDFYFASKNLQSDKDKNGNTVSGSLRKKIIAEIRKTKLTVDQKLLLLASRGYKPQDGDFSGMTAEAAEKRLLAYVRKITSGMTKEEKAQFAQVFGMEIKNNLIFI